VGVLSAAASRADVPVFPVVGAGGRAAADDLRLLPGVRVVDSPRAAVLLVVVGRLTRALLHPVLVVHDQLPGPRATLWWPVAGPDDEGLLAALPGVVTAEPGAPGPLQEVFVDLLLGRRPSDPPALPDIEANHWQGVGPYGHGGEGMMGGVPYGRPMAMQAPDPDGLMLDQLPLQVGPLFPALPPGLVLHLGLQGDVVRGATLGENPYRSWPGDAAVGPLDTAPFLDALTSTTPVADLELARARHHLVWLARTLALHGLAARGRRVLALARTLGPSDGPAVEALARRIRRDRGLAAATSGVGVLDRARLDAADGPVGGPVARAAGLAADARTDDTAYTGLGFEPVVQGQGDARVRLHQRVAEAAQALALAERAGARVREPGEALEGPRGSLAPGRALPSARLAALVPGLVDGMEWGDAVTAVASLDLDLEEAAAGPIPDNEAGAGAGARTGTAT
jgi:hypothetical protein